MLATLRRSRLLALALLLLGVPGLGGAWLQVAHPCQQEMPWLAGQPVAHGADDARNAAAGHAGHGSHEDPGCHCVGACESARGFAPTVRTALVALLDLESPARPPILHDAGPRTVRLAALHPPATAPPLV
jgi:hypothetical protein